MVVGGGGKIMAGRGWSWKVVGSRGWSHNLVTLMFIMPFILIETTSEPKANSHVYMYVFTKVKNTSENKQIFDKVGY